MAAQRTQRGWGFLTKWVKNSEVEQGIYFGLFVDWRLLTLYSNIHLANNLERVCDWMTEISTDSAKRDGIFHTVQNGTFMAVVVLFMNSSVLSQSEPFASLG